MPHIRARRLDEFAGGRFRVREPPNGLSAAAASRLELDRLENVRTRLDTDLDDELLSSASPISIVTHLMYRRLAFPF